MCFYLFTLSVFLKLPEEAKELDKELRKITKEKNEAVRSQDFEKVRVVLSKFSNFPFNSTILFAPLIIKVLIMRFLDNNIQIVLSSI